MDVKIMDGDMVLDQTGNPVYIEGPQEILQRVLFCITAKKGTFLYDKEMGYSKPSDISSERSLRKLEARLREAIISLEGTQLYLLGAEETPTGDIKAHITVTHNNENISTEVII